MRKTAVNMASGILAALGLAGLAAAQTPRVQFPTPITPAAAPTATYAAPGSVASPAPLTAGGAAVANPAPGLLGTTAQAPATAPIAVPGTGIAPAPTYAPVTGLASPGSAPAVLPGAVAPPSTYSAPSLVPNSAASFQGGIQPAPGWDPYSASGIAPAPLLPSDPFLNPAVGGPGTSAPFTRFLQRIRFQNHWLVDLDGEQFGSNDSLLTATFGIPFRNQQTPFLITPGFGLHLLDGPISTSADPAAASPDLPPQLYDAFLDVQWNPQLSPSFALESGARIGVYSDFSSFIDQSLRVQGHALAVAFLSETMRVKIGVDYINRNRIKLLPAGGVVWTPNEDSRFDILFPNPKLARRLSTVGSADCWYYLRGEYGGGAWTVEREFSGVVERFDYNDIRVALGLEFEQPSGPQGFFEVGVAFEREILFVDSPEDTVNPDTTIFLGVGIAF